MTFRHGFGDAAAFERAFGVPLTRVGFVEAAGRPSVVADPNGPIAALYGQIARKIAVKVAEKAKDMSLKFPSIVIKND